MEKHGHTQYSSKGGRRYRRGGGEQDRERKDGIKTKERKKEERGRDRKGEKVEENGGMKEGRV